MEMFIGRAKSDNFPGDSAGILSQQALSNQIRAKAAMFVPASP
jgi:hypothetical protein